MDTRRKKYQIKAFATQGINGDDENRLKTLLGNFDVDYYPFEKKSKIKSFTNLMKYISKEKADLIVMEGTGIGGGLALILASLFKGIPFIVSSGDPIGPFVRKKSFLFGAIFQLYEKILCKRAIGFVGWTPYLVGRALTYGSKFGMTAAGWAPYNYKEDRLIESRKNLRKKYAIPEGNIVIGIVGSLNWNNKIGYCYGYELVSAVVKLQRKDVSVLIVGDGTGQSELKKIAKNNTENIVFTGRVAREDVPDYLAVMDLASLPQSVDQLGSFRYTTKVSEYLSAGLPIITGMLPMSYDLNESDCIVRIKGKFPWGNNYINNLVDFLERITINDTINLKNRVPKEMAIFNKDYQVNKMTDFIDDILDTVNSK